jgi:hypothetical protein
MLVSDPPDQLEETSSSLKTKIFGLLRSRDPSKVPTTVTLEERSKHKAPQVFLGRFSICQGQ